MGYPRTGRKSKASPVPTIGVKPSPEELALINQVKAVTAQCDHIHAKTKKRCEQNAILGTTRCVKHPRRGRPPVLGLYSKALQNAPTWTALMEEVKATGQYRKQEDDLVFLRTSLMQYITRNAIKIEMGDEATIDNVNNMISRISNLIERMDGKKFVVTLNGINVIINQVIQIITLHLEHDPERLKLISDDLSKVKLPPGSLAK